MTMTAVLCWDSQDDSDDDEEEDKEGEGEGDDGGYFDTPPAVDTDIVFTDMNLSRPLLRVSRICCDYYLMQ